LADDKDKSQKTEEPSQKRLDDAVKKGNVITSKEVTTFVLIFSITIFIANILPYMLEASPQACKNM
jgi:flagellar biosynthetic protein FlhB